MLTVLVSLALAIPAGYALARLKLPMRALILVIFLLPQAFPSVAIYINVARIFYSLGLTGTVGGVVLVHATHGLVYSVWIAAAAFAAVDRDLELAARNMGASPLRTFFTITLPLATPGLIASAIFVFLGIARRIHRHVLRRRAAGLDVPLLLYNASMGELPDRLNHRAHPARAVRALHAVHRALPARGCSQQGRALSEALLRGCGCAGTRSRSR